MSSIVLTQCPWRAEDPAADLRAPLEVGVRAARRRQPEPQPVLVLLPLAASAAAPQDARRTGRCG
ncbi:MAG: hypothetical protein IT481_16040 [Gammaproteobacteria bacterium]|nr:hypothetical protein [Gammaproteobacteria bacterium]